MLEPPWNLEEPSFVGFHMGSTKCGLSGFTTCVNLSALYRRKHCIFQRFGYLRCAGFPCSGLTFNQ